MKIQLFFDGELIHEWEYPVAGEDLRAGDFVSIDPETGKYVRFGAGHERVDAVVGEDIPKGHAVKILAPGIMKAVSA